MAGATKGRLGPNQLGPSLPELVGSSQNYLACGDAAMFANSAHRIGQLRTRVTGKHHLVSASRWDHQFVDEMQTHAYCAALDCPEHPEIIPEDSSALPDERVPCPVCGSKSRLYTTFPTAALGFAGGAMGSITLSGSVGGPPPAGARGSIELVARSTLTAGGVVSGAAEAVAESTATAEGSVIPAADVDSPVINNAAVIDAVLADLVAPEGTFLSDDVVSLDVGVTRVLGEIAADHEVTIRMGHLDEPGGPVVIAVLSRYKGTLATGVGLTPRDALLGMLEAMEPGYNGELKD